MQGIDSRCAAGTYAQAPQAGAGTLLGSGWRVWGPWWGRKPATTYPVHSNPGRFRSSLSAFKQRRTENFPNDFDDFTAGNFRRKPRVARSLGQGRRACVRGRKPPTCPSAGLAVGAFRKKIERKGAKGPLHVLLVLGHGGRIFYFFNINGNAWRGDRWVQGSATWTGGDGRTRGKHLTI